jgi:hypothetical protein
MAGKTLCGVFSWHENEFYGSAIQPLSTELNRGIWKEKLCKTRMAVVASASCFARGGKPNRLSSIRCSEAFRVIDQLLRG